jgi:Na+/melibiose symporter-like transporter
LALAVVAPASALASEAASAEGAAEGGGILGPPILYSIQWGLLLALLAITVLFLVGSLSPDKRGRISASRARAILIFSGLQVLLVFAILFVNFLGEEYHEPALPGYIRHVTLILTGVLLAVCGFLARRRRF